MANPAKKPNQRIAVRTGELVTFEIDQDFKIDPKELELLGFGAYTPRNDFRAAFIKSLQKVYKNNDRLYRRFNDVKESVKFGLFIENKSESDIEISKEIVATLDKEHGNITYSSNDPEFDVLKDQLLEVYEAEKKSVDSKQFRLLVAKIILNDFYGVPIKKRTGVYFIDKAFDAKFENVKKLLDFPGVRTISFAMHDDLGALEAISSAVRTDIMDDMESLIKEATESVDGGKISRRKLNGIRDRSNKILAKATAHRENLQESAEDVMKKVLALKNKLAKVEETDVNLTFLESMALL